MAEKKQIIADMSTRQRVTAVIVVIVVLIVIWQLIGLFRGGSSTVTPAATPPTATNTEPAAKPPTMTNEPNKMGGMPSSGAATTQPQQITPQMKPQPAQVTQNPTTGVTPREAELIKMQEETQAKYLAALNELQMLKVARDIAEANQAIMSAKLATVASEKKIIDMLSPTPVPAPTPTTEGYAKNLVNPTPAGAPTPPQPPKAPPTPPVSVAPPPPAAANYIVISVTQLQYRWSAVLGNKGNLYNVHVGDILPPDGSRVISIDKTGVVLVRDGVKSKVSMVPII